MPHINLPEGLQGIRGPMAFRPETAKPLNELAEILLHAPNSLAPGERELIATYVSSLNDYTPFQARAMSSPMVMVKRCRKKSFSP